MSSPVLASFITWPLHEGAVLEPRSPWREPGSQGFPARISGISWLPPGCFFSHDELQTRRL